MFYRSHMQICWNIHTLYGLKWSHLFLNWGLNSGSQSCRCVKITILEEIEHLANQSVFRNVTELECGAIIGCDCCSESVCDISSFLQLALSGVIARPKHLETTTTQTRSRTSCGVTAQARWLLHHAEESPALCCLSNYSAANLIRH